MGQSNDEREHKKHRKRHRHKKDKKKEEYSTDEEPAKRKRKPSDAFVSDNNEQVVWPVPEDNVDPSSISVVNVAAPVRTSLPTLAVSEKEVVEETLLTTLTTSKAAPTEALEDNEEDEAKLVPWYPFECSQCQLTVKTFHKELRVSDGFYPYPVFYMRDPFHPPPRLRGRRPVLADYVVLGASCKICEAAVCLAKSCSLYFGAHFCATCVLRERKRFPEKLVESLTKALPANATKKEEQK